MTRHINYTEVAPKALRALFSLEQHVRQSGLDRALVELVYLRVSQINGCAYCIDMHTKDLRAAGETEQRLYLLSVHHEVPFFSDRERAALSWAEAVTRLGEHGVPDAVFDEVRRHFDDAQIVELTLAVATINAWNRMSIAMRTPAGGYTPKPQ